MSKDDEVRSVVAELEDKLTALRASVAAMADMLEEPPPNGDAPQEVTVP